MPPSTVRWSLYRRPVGGLCGMRGLTIFHSASVSDASSRESVMACGPVLSCTWRATRSLPRSLLPALQLPHRRQPTLLLSSVLLLAGNVLLGVAVWRSGTLPRWAGAL